jgi:groucho
MMPSQEIKKIKKEEKEGGGHQSDGEKSDQDLVVDDACSEPMSPMPPNQSGQHPHHNHNGNTSSPPQNGMLKKMEHPGERIVTPNSPRSSSSDRGSSSNGSTTPSNSQKVKLEEKPSTPGVNGNGGIPKSIVAKPPAYPPGYMGPMNGGNPHEMQAAYAAAAAAGVPGLPPGHPGFRGVPVPMGPFDNHPQMRAPPMHGPALSAMAGGKP